MAYPTASNYPQHSGVMIPEIWSAQLLVKFYEATVLAEISNTDYEGEIRNQGDTVHIRTTPTITIKDYTKGQELSYETPQPSTVELQIDKGKYWAFTSDDVDTAQADYEYVDNWTRDASEQLKITIDSDVLGDVYADAHPDNQGTSAGARTGSINLGASGGSSRGLTKDNVIDFIVDCGTVLDEQDVPEEDRWLVLPPWACALVKQSDLKDASLAGDTTSIVRNGRLGMIDRFTIYKSNLLTTEDDNGTKVTNAIFGHISGLTFASQLVKNEGPMRSERTFGDLYRGLQVYGYEAIKPEAIGWAYISRG